jgi:1-acyl-sn-glycerol-3-phosphate acyltransferase
VLEFLTRSFVLGFFDYRAEGAGHVPPRGGVIIASTHQSHLDPVMIRAPLTRAVGYVARKTLFANRLFGGMIRRLGAVELDRDAATPAGIRELVEILQAGAALVFFPEGTRTPDGEIGPLRPGIALLAKRAGVPVVPAAIEGSFACWPRSRRFFRAGRIRVVYGEARRFGPETGRREILEDLDGRLHELQARARRLA